MKKLDNILKLALTPNDEPDLWLNQKILCKAKEANRMEKRNINKFVAVVCSAALALGIGSVSIYAARKLMLPHDVIDEITDNSLLDAFSGDDAILINQTQSYSGYDVTLYGIVSGKKLSDYETVSDDGIHDDRTYAVVSIQKSDKTPLPSTAEDSYSDYSFLVSPFIEGYNPAFYNSFTLVGGYSEFEEDGVYYRISECDNIEMFADHKIYLGVLDNTFYDNTAYLYDEATGAITRNEAYDGLNALFELPLDPSKADPAAAADYIKSLEETPQEDTEDKSAEETDADRKIKEFMEAITPENLADYAVPVEGTLSIIKPDENGAFEYEYNLEDRGSGSGIATVTDFFPDKKPGMSEHFYYSYSEDGLDSLVIQTFTLNEDGTVTFQIYIPK